jgi:hypothetical protein
VLSAELEADKKGETGGIGAVRRSGSEVPNTSVFSLQTTSPVSFPFRPFTIQHLPFNISPVTPFTPYPANSLPTPLPCPLY